MCWHSKLPFDIYMPTKKIIFQFVMHKYTANRGFCCSLLLVLRDYQPTCAKVAKSARINILTIFDGFLCSNYLTITRVPCSSCSLGHVVFATWHVLGCVSVSGSSVRLELSVVSGPRVSWRLLAQSSLSMASRLHQESSPLVSFIGGNWRHCETTQHSTRAHTAELCQYWRWFHSWLSYAKSRLWCCKRLDSPSSCWALVCNSLGLQYKVS